MSLRIFDGILAIARPGRQRPGPSTIGTVHAKQGADELEPEPAPWPGALLGAASGAGGSPGQGAARRRSLSELRLREPAAVIELRPSAWLKPDLPVACGTEVSASEGRSNLW